MLAHASVVTRRTSSKLVTPFASFLIAASRRVMRPSWRACFRISFELALLTMSFRILSSTSRTSKTPVRQFVLSLPYELRLLAAFKPDVLSAIARIFVEVVFASYRARAGRERTKQGQCGAVTFVQRFGGSLNLNVHFHTVFLDGVFTRDAQEQVLFHPAHEPDAAELESIARAVHRRVTAWLARLGYVDGRPAEDHSKEPPEPGALIPGAGGMYCFRQLLLRQRGRRAGGLLRRR